MWALTSDKIIDGGNDCVQHLLLGNKRREPRSAHVRDLGRSGAMMVDEFTSILGLRIEIKKM